MNINFENEIKKHCDFIEQCNNSDSTKHHTKKILDINEDVVAEYKQLLNECLNRLNDMPNSYIKKRFMTYDLAAKIEKLLRG